MIARRELVALCICYVFAFDFADVLFMCTPASVADDVVVRLIAGVSWRSCLLQLLLLLTEHSTCRIHLCFPLVDFVLDFLHGVRLEFDQILFEHVVRAGSECESYEQFCRGPTHICWRCLWLPLMCLCSGTSFCPSAAAS